MSNLPQRPRPGSGSRPPGSSETPGRRLPAKPQPSQEGGGGLPKRTANQRPAPQRSTPQRPSADQPRTKPQPPTGRKPAPERPAPDRPNIPSKPRTTGRVKPRTRPVEVAEEKVVPSSPNRPEPTVRYEEPVETYKERGEREPTPYKREPDDDDLTDFEFSSTEEEDVIEHLNEKPAEELSIFDEPEKSSAYVEEPKPKKRNKKKKPPKESKKQEQAISSGGRGGLIALRATIIIGALALFGMGVKNTFDPPYVPSPDEVVSMVNTENNVLGFPTGEGSVFAQEFATAYLSVDDTEEREKQLHRYSTETLASSMVANRGSEDNTQSITEGPFVSPHVQQIDEFSAIFTVSAAINGKWVYLDVPVRANDEKTAFSVAGMPSFVSPPAVYAEYNPETETRTVDEEATSEVNTDIETFFEAWGASDQESLRRIIAPDATSEVTLGLRKAVRLSSVSNMQVYEPEDGNPNIRTGTAEVVWITVRGEGEGNDTTYNQTYDFTVEKLDDGRWYVKDVRSGVSSAQ